MDDDVQESSQRCALRWSYWPRYTLRNYFRRPPRLVRRTLGILQLTADTLETLVAAALVVVGAGCAGSNAGVPVVGDGPLHEKIRKEVDGHRQRMREASSGLPRPTLSTFPLEHHPNTTAAGEVMQCSHHLKLQDAKTRRWEYHHRVPDALGAVGHSVPGDFIVVLDVRVGKVVDFFCLALSASVCHYCMEPGPGITSEDQEPRRITETISADASAIRTLIGAAPPHHQKPECFVICSPVRRTRISLNASYTHGSSPAHCTKPYL